MTLLPAAAAVTRWVGSLDGLSPLRRPVRVLRGPLHRLMWTLHSFSADGNPLDQVIELQPGIRMSVDTNELVQQTVFLIGYEPEPVALVRRWLSSGCSAIDVGAHVGAITLVMARAVGNGTVLACEPNPKLAARLATNLALSNLANVVIREVAVGDSSGEAVLHIPSDPQHVGGSSLASGENIHHHNAQELRVKKVTLDELVDEARLRNVALVKVDVEGFEASVLAGGSRLLERDHPALIFEYSADWWTAAGASLSRVQDALAAVGYSQFKQITWSGLRRIPPHPPNRINIFAN